MKKKITFWNVKVAFVETSTMHNAQTINNLHIESKGEIPSPQ